MKWLLLLCLLAFSASFAHGGLTIYINGSSEPYVTYFAPVLALRDGVQSFPPRSGQLVHENGATRESEPTFVGNPLGKIFLVPEGRSFFDWIDAIQHQMPSGVLLRNGPDDAGIGSYEFRLPNGPSNVPLLGISIPTYNALVALLNNTDPSVTITAVIDDTGGPSSYRQSLTHPVFWIFSVILAFANSVCMGLAFVKWLGYYKALYTWIKTLPQAVMVLEFIGCAFRVIVWACDPMSQRVLFPHHVQLFFRTVSIPFSIASTLLLTMYWHESVARTSLTFSWSVEAFKIPCYILMAIIFAIEIVVDVMYLTNSYNIARWYSDYVVSATYLLMSILLGAYFIVTAIRIVAKLRSISAHKMTTSASLVDDSAERKRRRFMSKRTRKLVFGTALKLGISGLAWLGIVASGLVTISPAFTSGRPGPSIGTWSAIHSFVTIKAFCSVLALQPPEAQSRSNTRASSTKNSVVASTSNVSTPK